VEGGKVPLRGGPVKVKTFGFAKTAPPADATIVIDVRALGAPDVTAPVAVAAIERAYRHLDEVGDDAVIVFGCMYGEERSVAVADHFGRLVGVTPEHTTKNLPKGTFADDSVEAKLADFFNR